MKKLLLGLVFTLAFPLLALAQSPTVTSAAYHDADIGYGPLDPVTKHLAGYHDCRFSFGEATTYINKIKAEQSSYDNDAMSEAQLQVERDRRANVILQPFVTLFIQLAPNNGFPYYYKNPSTGNFEKTASPDACKGPTYVPYLVPVTTAPSASPSASAIRSAYHQADANEDFDFSFNELTTYNASTTVSQADKNAFVTLYIKMAGDTSLYYYRYWDSRTASMAWGTTKTKPLPYTSSALVPKVASLPPVAFHHADTNYDGKISIGEAATYIAAGTHTFNEVDLVNDIWKHGEAYGYRETGAGFSPFLAADTDHDFRISFNEYTTYQALVPTGITETVRIFNLLAPSSGNFYYWNSPTDTWMVKTAPPLPVLTVLVPNGGETWYLGEKRTIKWSSPWIVDLYVVPYHMNFEKPILLTKNVSGSSWDWIVGQGSSLITPDLAGTYQIFACKSGTDPWRNDDPAKVCDSSDSYFKIASRGVNSPITVTSPKGGETWVKGSMKNITWTPTTSACLAGQACPLGYPTQLVDIYLKYTCNGDLCARAIAKNVSGNTYQWFVGRVLYTPLPVGEGQYVVLVCKAGSSFSYPYTNCGESGYFKIADQNTTQAPTVKIVSSSAQLLSSNGEDSQIAGNYKIDFTTGSQPLTLYKNSFRVDARYVGPQSPTDFVSDVVAPSAWHTTQITVDGKEITTCTDMYCTGDSAFTIPANTTKIVIVKFYFNTRYLFGGQYRIRLLDGPTPFVFNGSSLSGDPYATTPNSLPITILGEKFAQIHRIGGTSSNNTFSPGDTMGIEGDRFNALGTNTIYFVEWNGTKYVDVTSLKATADGRGKGIKFTLPSLGSRTSIGIQVQNPNTPTGEYYNYGRSNIYIIQLAGGSVAQTQGISARVISSNASIGNQYNEDVQIAANFVVEVKTGAQPLKLVDRPLTIFIKGVLPSGTGTYDMAAPYGMNTGLGRYIHTDSINFGDIGRNSAGQYEIPANSTKRLTVKAYFDTKYLFSGVYTANLYGNLVTYDYGKDIPVSGNLTVSSSNLKPLTFTILGEKFAQIHRVDILGNYASQGQIYPGDNIKITGSRFNIGPNAVRFVEIGTGAVLYTKTGVPSADGKTLTVATPPASIIGSRTTIGVQVQNSGNLNVATSPYYNYGWGNVRYLPVMTGRGTTQTSITVTSPNGGESLRVGQSYNIQWTDGSGLGDLYTVELVHSNGGTSIINSGVKSGFTWSVGSLRDGNLSDGIKKIKVCLITDGSVSVCGTSNTFTVTSSPTPTLSAPTMVYPQDGQTLTCCSGYMFKVNPVVGASGYTWNFYQKDDNGIEQLIYAERRTANEFGIWEGAPYLSKFKKGRDIKVEIRAWKGDEILSEKRTITVHITQPPVTTTPTLVPYQVPVTTAQTPAPTVSAPTFDYDKDGIYHRVFVRFGTGGGQIAGIEQKPTSDSSACYSLTTGVAVAGRVGYDAPVCTVKSYLAGSSCGVYLQTKNVAGKPCQVKINYGLGSMQFESYLPTGSATGTGERIRQVPLSSTFTSSQTAAVINLIQALINLLSGR